ncbi:hypothetical protein PENSPDRAFT_692793 [Peniophora sp. CONT]|nr:hypothetical protein PENSPDRAFT_692793 [Peniophora sp. CONT]
MFENRRQSDTFLSGLLRCPTPPAELDTTLRPFFAPLPDPTLPRRSHSLLRSTRASRSRSPPRRARQIIDPGLPLDYIYTPRPTPRRRHRDITSMTTGNDLRELLPAAHDHIYIPRSLCTNANHGPTRGYVPAATTVAYISPTPAPEPA